jgi:hypothetical protein
MYARLFSPSVGLSDLRILYFKDRHGMIFECPKERGRQEGGPPSATLDRTYTKLPRYCRKALPLSRSAHLARNGCTGAREPYLYPMKKLVAPIFVLALAASPLSAEEEGFNLMEEGAKLFFRGLLNEMEPALDELEGMAREIEPHLQQFMTEMGPALMTLMDEVKDWSVYHPPEILPNGDIIIRRKTPQELEVPSGQDSPSEEIEL